MKQISVIEMVADYLKRNGYDGLYEPGECACLLEDLAPCDSESVLGCLPGYKTSCPTDNDDKPDSCEGDCRFHVGSR